MGIAWVSTEGKSLDRALLLGGLFGILAILVLLQLVNWLSWILMPQGSSKARLALWVGCFPFAFILLAVAVGAFLFATCAALM